jgi:hypothetical protein
LDQPRDHEIAPPSPPSFLLPFDAANLHSHDRFYKDLEEAKAAIFPVLTVHVRLNVLKGGRILVPTMFKLAGGVMIPATILVTTGPWLISSKRGFSKSMICGPNRESTQSIV